MPLREILPWLTQTIRYHLTPLPPTWTPEMEASPMLGRCFAAGLEAGAAGDSRDLAPVAPPEAREAWLKGHRLGDRENAAW